LAPGPVWAGAENFSPTGIRSPDLPALIPQSSSIPRQRVGHLTILPQTRLSTLAQTILRNGLHQPERSIDLSRTAFMFARGYPHMKKIRCLVRRKRNSCNGLSTSCFSLCTHHVLPLSNILPIVWRRSVCLTARTMSSRIPRRAVPSMLG